VARSCITFWNKKLVLSTDVYSWYFLKLLSLVSCSNYFSNICSHLKQHLPTKQMKTLKPQTHVMYQYKLKPFQNTECTVMPSRQYKATHFIQKQQEKHLSFVCLDLPSPKASSFPLQSHNLSCKYLILPPRDLENKTEGKCHKTGRC